MPAHLDTPFSRGYKAALFSAAVALLPVASAVGTGGVVVRGAVLPPGSQQVGENRYKSPIGYTDTLAFLAKQYKGNPRKPIVNQPGVRGVHIVNDGKGEWEGLNVYELDGETRIFVVLRDPEAPDGGR